MGLAFTDFNFEIARGDDRAIDFVVDLDGVAQDITGWSIRFTARTAVPLGTVTDDADAVLAYSTTGGGVTITNAATGALTVAIAGADTYDLGLSTELLWDLQGVDGDGNVATLTTGKLTIKGEITRATT